MNSLVVAFVTFICVFGGVLLGSLLRKKLPDHHLQEDSRDAVKMGTGVIATLTALVLGLLISSAKSSFDATCDSVSQAGADAVMLDRLMEQYGPETKDIRAVLRRVAATVIISRWPEDKDKIKLDAPLDPVPLTAGLNSIHNSLLKLSPQTDAQKSLQSQAVQMIFDLQQTRWRAIEHSIATLPMPFMIVLICWLTILFASFSMLTPANATNMTVFFLCVLSVAGAIFLLVEMIHPEEGLIKIPSAPLIAAFEQLGH